MWKQTAGCNTFDYLGILVLLTMSFCVRFNPGTGQDSLWKLKKPMQELMSEEQKKYTVNACTNYEKIIKAQSFCG